MRERQERTTKSESEVVYRMSVLAMLVIAVMGNGPETTTFQAAVFAVFWIGVLGAIGIFDKRIPTQPVSQEEQR